MSKIIPFKVSRHQLKESKSAFNTPLMVSFNHVTVSAHLQPFVLDTPHSTVDDRVNRCSIPKEQCGEYICVALNSTYLFLYSRRFLLDSRMFHLECLRLLQYFIPHRCLLSDKHSRLVCLLNFWLSSRCRSSEVKRERMKAISWPLSFYLPF